METFSQRVSLVQNDMGPSTADTVIMGAVVQFVIVQNRFQTG